MWDKLKLRGNNYTRQVATTATYISNLHSNLSGQISLGQSEHALLVHGVVIQAGSINPDTFFSYMREN